MQLTIRREPNRQRDEMCCQAMRRVSDRNGFDLCFLGMTKRSFIPIGYEDHTEWVWSFFRNS